MSSTTLLRCPVYVLRNRKTSFFFTCSTNTYSSFTVFEARQLKKPALTRKSVVFVKFHKCRSYLTKNFSQRRPNYNTFASIPFTPILFTQKVATDVLSFSNYLLHKRSISNMAAEGIKLCWNVKKEDIENDAEKLMERMKKVYDAIGSLSDDQVTYENVVQVRFKNP